MVDGNSDLMMALVGARQEQLRNEAKTGGAAPGPVRRMVGRRLIRVGEWIGGAPRPKAAHIPAARLALR